MLFNSINFAIFLPVVFILYWSAKKVSFQFQNVLLLAANCLFYGCWDWRFLFLLAISILLGYYSGIKISEAIDFKTRKRWLWLSIFLNLVFLGVFKYYNFFASSFSEAISHLGLRINPWTLKIILPLGISFYTFHGLSYIIDIYKNRIKPEKSLINYSIFVSFFPLLVAGPIERATHLLPQIRTERTFDLTKAIDGLKQILWGLFKKIVIADQCATHANLIFNNSATYSGSTHVLGAIFFSFQIYCDFSGYSDIALGTARLFGIELLRNFAFPYFSRNIAEFWRRWHISLSSWFRDYLYIPIGGSKGGQWISITNILIIFTVSGFWHGANWTFIIWGLLNALYIIPSILLKTNRRYLNIAAEGKSTPSMKEFLSIGITFSLTTFAWIFFRSPSLKSALSYIAKIFSSSLFTIPEPMAPTLVLALIIVFIAIEWQGRAEQYAISKLGLRWPKVLRWATYYIIILAIFYFAGAEQKFIYFQF